jgi:hypothetical protein
MGTYRSTAPLWYDARKRVVGIDICLIPEILILWKKNIITIESCCGHNSRRGYIMVEENHVCDMIILGYEQDPKRENCFYPKYLLEQGEGKKKNNTVQATNLD